MSLQAIGDLVVCTPDHATQTRIIRGGGLRGMLWEDELAPRLEQVHYPTLMLLPMLLINLFSEADYIAGRAAKRSLRVRVLSPSCLPSAQDIIMTKRPWTAWPHWWAGLRACWLW